MRGISEAITAILLVLITVILVTFVFIWVPKFIPSSSPTEEEGSLGCLSAVNYVIDGHSFNHTTGILTLRITNFGEQPVYGFGVAINNETEVIQYLYGDSRLDQAAITSTNTLQQGESTYLKANLTGSEAIMNSSRIEIEVTNIACSSPASRMVIIN